MPRGEEVRLTSFASIVADKTEPSTESTSYGADTLDRCATKEPPTAEPQLPDEKPGIVSYDDNLNENGETTLKTKKTWKEQEAEMEAKLSWIREQIKILKLQDKSLMRQFLDLRSVINKIKLNRVGSVTDVSALDSSSSVNGILQISDNSLESAASPSSVSLHDDDLPSYRPRTVSLSEKGKFSDAPRGLVTKTKELFL
ncbi:uncharacterized protein LOC144445745 [Glandiceps talaboti]